MDFDSIMRWFDPSRPCQHDPLAQLAEHLTFNQGVPRSSRGWVTIVKAHKLLFVGFFATLFWVYSMRLVNIYLTTHAIVLKCMCK